MPQITITLEQRNRIEAEARGASRYSPAYINMTIKVSVWEKYGKSRLYLSWLNVIGKEESTCLDLNDDSDLTINFRADKSVAAELETWLSEPDELDVLEALLLEDDEPVADEPVADEPVADEPVADEPVATEDDNTKENKVYEIDLNTVTLYQENLAEWGTGQMIMSRVWKGEAIIKINDRKNLSVSVFKYELDVAQEYGHKGNLTPYVLEEDIEIQMLDKNGNVENVYPAPKSYQNKITIANGFKIPLAKEINPINQAYVLIENAKGLSVTEIAYYVGVSRAYVKAEIAAGRLPDGKMGNQYAIPVAAFLEWASNPRRGSRST